MALQNLLVQKKDHYAIVTINRPDKLNALNNLTVTELYTVMKELAADEEVRAIVLTGSGEKAFVAGADISEINEQDEISGELFALKGQRVFRFIEQMGKPVIAAINGYALGGGCELAMACHLRICSTRAKFGQPEINLGLIPGYGGTQRLPRLIGRSDALYLLLTGEMIDAQRAYDLGLVSEVVEPDQLLERAEALAKIIAEKPIIATRYILKAVDDGLNLPIDAALNLEAELFGKICATEDMKEGTRAFLEKRKPQFKGR